VWQNIAGGQSVAKVIEFLDSLLHDSASGSKQNTSRSTILKWILDTQVVNLNRI
jgi:hypothetical protein